MSEDFDVLKSYVIKTDQLNADDLISSPITVTIEHVVKTGSIDQPIAIGISGGWKPWKPCLSMVRVMGYAWGSMKSGWIGKQVTLYRDPDVKNRVEVVGGIRIFAVSNIDAPLTVKLTVTRGQKKAYTVQPIVTAPPAPPTFLDKWRASFAGATPGVMAFAKGIAEAYQERDLAKLAAATIGIDALEYDDEQSIRQIELLDDFANDVEIELRTN